MGHGALVWMRTVYGSTTSAWPSGAHGVAPRSFSLASAMRSTVNFTASASNASPLWNLTPLRSLNSQTVGATFLNDSARPGTILRSASRSSSVSNMLMARFAAGVSWWFCGSSVVGSTPWATTTVPFGCASASATDPMSRPKTAIRASRRWKERIAPPRVEAID